MLYSVLVSTLERWGSDRQQQCEVTILRGDDLVDLLDPQFRPLRGKNGGE